ncbi:MAG: chemotaxis-specific protein-glutamate methyltransferase CheB [Lachnospiraceae bacterium]|uniref:chemotaxis-specific protein-glutamate methyltransferase CheB n=1 Tax=Roseburia hominis TaxID=301301 RepID=UPI001F344147|nr:chemotaxis-specific protein-glutamate methyltransferase CheB [Roseburia hominis]MDY4840363.1 chemotaxis-specific protein-glutamate methyltransferase CheB [Lachnospiraceae bacterium]
MKKNILVVDDSALMRKVICDIINSESKFQAKDVCRDGVEAYEKLKTTQYDGVVLDVNMPRMGGLELLEKLQQDKIKANVIMVSTLTTKDAEITMLAMERGAIDFVTKPTNIIEAKGIDFRNRLISVLEAVYQTRSQVRRMQNFSATVSQKPVTPTKLQKGFGNKLVALACSTGGPKALQSVIPYLPKDMNAPMVLVQHMPQGFTKSMADRLNEISPIRVKEAEHGDVLEKGCVYVAPGGKHMRITRNRDGRHVVTLSDEPAIGGLKPCADIMYESLRDCGYDEVTCVVLTGMGADGTKGILSLREKKDLYVISQSAETCVVYGMPKSIAETGVVDSVVPLAEVAQTIIKNVGVQ